MRENATLIKFGNYEHLTQLRNEGLLYMNNLSYFWKIEDEELRGDLYDGIHEIRRGNKGSINNKDGSILPLTMTEWELRILPPEAEKINIFCMYALSPSKGTFPIDKKNFKFGDYALILTSLSKFIKRISQKVEEEFTNTSNINPVANLVEYVNNDYIGKIGPFRKRNSFAYQSEWRFVCYDGTGKERIIKIGSIKDISIIIPSIEVNQTISIDKSGRMLIEQFLNSHPASSFK